MDCFSISYLCVLGSSNLPLFLLMVKSYVSSTTAKQVTKMTFALKGKEYIPHIFGAGYLVGGFNVYGFLHYTLPRVTEHTK